MEGVIVIKEVWYLIIWFFSYFEIDIFSYIGNKWCNFGCNL